MSPTSRLLLLRVVFALVATATSFSTVRSQTLWGVTRSTDGTSLPGVNVFIPGLQRGAVSDSDGRYEISHLEPGTYRVQFSFVGFRTQIREVTVGEADVKVDARLEEDPIWTDEVLVETEKTDALTLDSRSVSVLESRRLDEVRGQTLGETLEHLPGLATLQTGPSISKPIVRGLHSQRVLVLNAGVAQEGQQWGGEHAPEIDPFAPVRIEVVKGVAGVEYGAGAIGGVIRLEPLELPDDPSRPLSGTFAGNAFSNNYQGAASLYLQHASSRLPGVSWRVQGSLRRAGDARAPDYVITNSAFEEQNAAVTLGYRKAGLDLMGHVSHFGTELGIFSGAHIGNRDDLLRAIERGEPLVTPDFSFDIDAPKQRISHELATLRGTYSFDSGAKLTTQYGFQYNHRQEFDAHRPYNDSLAALNRPAFELTLASHSIESTFHHRPVGNLLGVVGISGMAQTNRNGRTGFLIPNFRAFTGGIFARETWLRNEVQLDVGTRLDYRWVRAWPRENGASGDFVRRVNSYVNVSGVVGGLWHFSDSWSIGGNLGSSWRPPSVNELYNYGVHHGTAQFEIGDPDLSSERSTGIDATLRHSGTSTRLEASVYATYFDGFIYLFPDPEPRVTIRGTFPTFFYAQSDARLTGFDASAEVDLSRLFTTGVVVSVVRGDNLETNEPLVQMPADRLRLVGHVNIPSFGIARDPHFEAEWVLTARQTRYPANADYADPPAGYRLLNLSIAADLQAGNTPIHLHASVQNALNVTYRDYLSRFRYFVDDPGRSFVLRMSVPIGAS